MDYLEFNVTCLEQFREILIAELAEIGFDSFLETEEGFQAYAFADGFPREAYDQVVARYLEEANLKIQEGLVPKVNWNEEWEKNYDPISIDNFVHVRASFHRASTGYLHEIVINPKMSFGTGHHATTYQLLALQGNIDHRGKRVLDAGSGTGILAIMAHKLGAKEVEAFDIDDWCVENGNENFALNGMAIQMGLGTIRELRPKGKVDILLANINKNVLLDEMEEYARLLLPGGLLLLSGFYVQDVEDMVQKASTLKLHLMHSSSKEQWAALCLQKEGAGVSV